MLFEWVSLDMFSYVMGNKTYWSRKWNVLELLENDMDENDEHVFVPLCWRNWCMAWFSCGCLEVPWAKLQEYLWLAGTPHTNTSTHQNKNSMQHETLWWIEEMPNHSFWLLECFILILRVCLLASFGSIQVLFREPLWRWLGSSGLKVIPFLSAIPLECASISCKTGMQNEPRFMQSDVTCSSWWRNWRAFKRAE